jgi:hypothetical protein
MGHFDDSIDEMAHILLRNEVFKKVLRFLRRQMFGGGIIN